MRLHRESLLVLDLTVLGARLNRESLPLQVEVLSPSPPIASSGKSLKKEVGQEKTGTDPSEERDVATTSCYYSYLIKLTNHVIIRGGFSIFLPLRWWCLLISL